MVLLHANLHDRHDFDPIAPSLAKTHRVIAIDWPGHGDSDEYRSVTAHALANVLEEVVGQLDVRRAVFIGNSVGGYAAARLAIRQPDRVASLVLVNTGGFVKSTVLTRAASAAFGTPSFARRVMRLMVRGYMQVRCDSDQAIVDRVMERAATPAGIDTFTSMWRSFAASSYDLRDQAGSIAAPVLVAWGVRDRLVPLRYGRRTQAAIAGSRLETFPTGHVVFSSAPEDFLRVVTPFIDEAFERASKMAG